MGDVDFLKLVLRKEALEVPVMEAYDGIVLSVGPGKYFALFTSIDQAVEAALTARRIIAENDSKHTDSTPINQKFSVHLGDV